MIADGWASAITVLASGQQVRRSAHLTQS